MSGARQSAAGKGDANRTRNYQAYREHYDQINFGGGKGVKDVEYIVDHHLGWGAGWYGYIPDQMQHNLGPHKTYWAAKKDHEMYMRILEGEFKDE